MKRPDIEELKELANLVKADKRENMVGDVANLDPAELLSKLDYHGITLLADYFKKLPVQLNSGIAQRKAMMAATDALKHRALEELFTAFKHAELGPAVLFKGSALAHTVYPKPWLRPRSDSDIIVEPNQRKLFHEVFTQLGYQRQFAIEGDYVSYQSTYSKALAGQSAMNIDLHWRINNRQILARAFTATELFENGASLGHVISNAHIPSPEDSIIIASLHRLGHHQNEERLTWLYDIHLLVESLTPHHWQKMLSKTASKQLSAITLDALKNCHLLFNTDIPSEHLDALSAQSQSPEPSQIFLQRDLSEWRYFLNDLNAMPNFSEKLGFIRETILPNSSYIREQMGTRSATYGHLKRLVQGVRRFL